MKVLYLPTSSTNQGRFLLFKDYYGTTTNSSFTVSTTGTDLIDDYNSLLTFSNAFGSVSLLADGVSAWRTIGMYDGLATPAAPSTGLDLNTIAGLIVWSDATTYTSAQTLTSWTNKATAGYTHNYMFRLSRHEHIELAPRCSFYNECKVESIARSQYERIHNVLGWQTKGWN